MSITTLLHPVLTRLAPIHTVLLHLVLTRMAPHHSLVLHHSLVATTIVVHHHPTTAVPLTLENSSTSWVLSWVLISPMPPKVSVSPKIDSRQAAPQPMSTLSLAPTSSRTKTLTPSIYRSQVPRRKMLALNTRVTTVSSASPVSFTDQMSMNR